MFASYVLSVRFSLNCFPRNKVGNRATPARPRGGKGHQCGNRTKQTPRWRIRTTKLECRKQRNLTSKNNRKRSVKWEHGTAGSKTNTNGYEGSPRNLEEPTLLRNSPFTQRVARHSPKLDVITEAQTAGGLTSDRYRPGRHRQIHRTFSTNVQSVLFRDCSYARNVFFLLVFRWSCTMCHFLWRGTSTFSRAQRILRLFAFLPRSLLE